MIDIGANTLIRYGIIGLLIVAACLGLIAYGEHRKQLEWDASITQQALALTSNLINQARNTAATDTKLHKTEQATAGRIRIRTEEVVRYVESPATKCLLSPEFVSSFNHLSQLLDPSADSLPPATDAPRSPDESPKATATDAAVLRAYEHSVIQLATLWDVYASLVEWVRTSRAIALEGTGRTE